MKPITIERRRILAGCCLAGLSAIASECLAADRSWGNTAGGTFSTSTNWINGLLAGTNDVAIFNRSRGTSQTTYTVSFAANAQNQSVFVGPDVVTFALGGRTYTTTAISGNEIGTSAAFTSQLTVQNGVFNMTGLLTPQMLVGGVPGRVGSLILTNNATLIGAPRLLVGTASATGVLTLNGFSGGTATLSLLDLGSGAGGRGTLDVTGPFAAVTTGSLIVGNAGTGTMLVDIASVLTNSGTATIGNGAGANGFVNLENARWNQPGSLTIGAAGAGTVNVVNGARLIGSTAVMASGTTSTATVRVGGPGSGSQWTNTGTLTIADFGQATLNIDGGGLVSAGTTIIGLRTGSAGTLSISGAGSSATFGTFIVGNSGTATVNVTGGGVLNAGLTVMANNSGGTSTMNVSGAGSGATVTDLTIGDVDSSTVNITDGGRLTCLGSTDIGFNFQSSGFGRVAVSGNGSRWINSGEIRLFSGIGNSINISNGGTVECNGASMSSPVTVDGVGSRWVNTGSLGVDSSMTISNGGAVENTDPAEVSHVRFDSFARVEGAGSTWNVAGTLEVGGFDSRLSLSSGGHVQAANTLVKTDGTIIISSSGSRLTTGGLTLGFGTNSGSENLFVQFGGSVVSQNGKLAGHNSSISLVSSATVRDVGSTWQNAGSLIVGGDGTASFPGHGRLDVLNGGSVSNGDAFVAFSPSSDGTVTVAGTQGFSPATWTTNGNLFVGGSAIAAGGDATLRVLAGGLAVVTDTLTLRAGNIVDLDGGTLTVGAIVGDGALIFQAGRLNITADSPLIGIGNPLDGNIIGSGRTVNVTNATSIIPGGVLRMQGGTYLSGGGINNFGQISVSLGRAVFVNPIVNDGSIVVNANSTIEFSSSLTGTGIFTGPGTKIFRTGSNAVIANIDTPGQTIVQAGGTLRADRIREASLTVQSGGVVNTNPGGTDATTNRLTALTVIGTGRLDLADNALVIDYAAASPLDSVKGLLTSGFAGGSWNGAGINSSAAAAEPNRALGFAEAIDIGSPATFAGEAIDTTTVLVRFTLPGDANLDRTVNIGDFSLLAANFNLPAYWARGDFNFDGTAGIGDFALLAANFNATLPPAAAVPHARVPEPAAAAACLGVIALTAPRRRRDSSSQVLSD